MVFLTGRPAREGARARALGAAAVECWLDGAERVDGGQG